MKSCYQHRQRSLFAYCDQCARPCCDDCCVAVFEEYFCERCKGELTRSVQGSAVQPDALRAALIGGGGIFALGFLLGPYALFRTRVARAHLRRSPWLRGRWHVRAAWILGGLATLQGLVWLLGETVLRP